MHSSEQQTGPEYHQLNIENDNDDHNNFFFVNNKIQNQKSEGYLFNYCLTFVGFVGLVCFWSLLSIIVLSYSYEYKNDITCSLNDSFPNNPNINISIYVGQTPNPSQSSTVNLAETIGPFAWMQWHGVIGLIEGIFIATFLLSSLDEKMVRCMLLSVVFLIPIVLFRFAWLIVGAILFWRDCPHLSPTSVNNLMWATLILGFFGMFMRIGTSKTKSQK